MHSGAEQTSFGPLEAFIQGGWLTRLAHVSQVLNLGSLEVFLGGISWPPWDSGDCQCLNAIGEGGSMKMDENCR